MSNLTHDVRIALGASRGSRTEAAAYLPFVSE